VRSRPRSACRVLRGERNPGGRTNAAAAVGSAVNCCPTSKKINFGPCAPDPERRHNPQMPRGGDAHHPERKSARFSRGFVLSALAIGLLVLLYVFSPQFQEAVPAFDALILPSYVAAGGLTRRAMGSGRCDCTVSLAMVDARHPSQDS